MKICILPSWYRTKQDPTLGSFFREQANALSKQGLDVTVVYCHVHKGRNSFENQCPKDETECFSEMIRHAYYRVPFTAWIVQAVNTLKMINQLNKAGHIDVIHAHSFVGGFFAFLAHRLFHIPYVITEHSTNFSRGELTNKDRWMIRLGYKHAGKLFSVSEGLRKDMITYTSSPIEVLVNMVDDEFFKTQLSDIKQDPFTFFSVGYLTYKKGMDILIRAMSNVIKINDRITLRIGGDGEQRQELQDLAANLKLESHVMFLGALSRSEVVREMSRCDAFVLASRHETFGIVYLEAMACGKPIIMTDTDAHQMIADPSVGTVVSKEDVRGLADAMLKTADRISAYDSENIRNYCYQKFSQHVVITRLINIYEDLLKGGKA